MLAFYKDNDYITKYSFVQLVAMVAPRQVGKAAWRILHCLSHKAKLN